jgi:hypothetical protein
MSLGHSTLIFAICNNIKAHLKILGNRLKDIKLNDSTKKIQEELKDVINSHQDIIQWVERLNDIYSPLLNTMSIYYGLLIGVSALQIIVVIFNSVHQKMIRTVL